MVTTVENVHSGGAWVLVGDPTQAAGAGMVELGILPNVSVQLQIARWHSQNEVGQRLPDGTFGLIRGATVELTMMEVSATILAAVYNDITDNTSWVGANTAFGQLTPFTVSIVPNRAKLAGEGLTGLDVQWIPKGVASNIGAFINALEKGGSDDTVNNYTATIEALLATDDQSSNPIDAEGQIWFKGDPAGPLSAATPAWSLPSDYTS